MLHKPVLLEEVLELIAPSEGKVVVDATLGSGGHSARILEKLGSAGKLIAVDQDPAAIERSQYLAERFPGKVLFYRSNFVYAREILKSLNIPGVDAVVIDTGFSSDQLEDPARGLSFDRDGPLDMRLDPDGPLTAAEIVNEYSEEELADIFWKYGEERNSRRFARVIAEEREKKPIQTTHELVEVLGKVITGYTKSKRHVKIRARHFATRIFQALRIKVNDELSVLEQGLQNWWGLLNSGGRLAVISFHSLEDRIVKYQFRSWHQEGLGQLIVKKPVIAGREEQIANPRSRSAKLRGIEKK